MVSDIKKSLEMDLDINTVLSNLSNKMYDMQNEILRNNKIQNSDIESFLKKESCYIKSFDKDEIQEIYLDNKGNIQVSCKYTSYWNYERHEESWIVIIPDHLVEAYEKYGKEVFDFKNDESEVSYEVFKALLKEYMETLLFQKIKEYKNLLATKRDEKQKKDDLLQKKKDEEDKLLYEALKLRFEGSK